MRNSSRDTVTQFRLDILDKVDEIYEERGITPDHIIIDKNLFNIMKDGRRFETLSSEKHNNLLSYRSRMHQVGYVGMVAWQGNYMESNAILTTDEILRKFIPQAKDF